MRLTSLRRIARSSCSNCSHHIVLIALSLTILSACTTKKLPTEPDASSKPITLIPSSGAVASAHPYATQAGLSMLKNGGNAFDAAVAVASTLAVVEPYGSGMGGGGFWLLYDAKQNRYVMIDARETAPLKATEDMYVVDGEVDRDLAINTPLSAGIPGQAAAFDHIAKKYGALPLSESLGPAIQHANNGFPVSPVYQRLATMRLNTLNRYETSAGIFLNNGEVPSEQDLIKQPGLAKTLTAIATQGAKGFYQGEIAKELVEAVQQHDGIWTLEDLAEYRIVERAPIISTFGAHTLISAPPPSSGGIALAAMFNMLEPLDYTHLNNPDQMHLVTEVMRRAYFDRSQFLGDPDYFSVPQKHLISKTHATELMKSYTPGQATPNEALGPLIEATSQGENTTHFSIIDGQGNIASVTLSINLPFGSGFTAGKTGVLLNNEMDDFSAAPQAPNAYGLIGGIANRIEPGKRPLSSMSPTIIQMPNHTAILGTPGGSRIITMVFLSALAAAEGKPVEQWVSLPRFHHQYEPNHIQIENNSFDQKVIQSLVDKGHQVKELTRTYGNMQAILWDRKNNRVTAASDPRGIGSAEVLNP